MARKALMRHWDYVFRASDRMAGSLLDVAG